MWYRAKTNAWILTALGVIVLAFAVRRLVTIVHPRMEPIGGMLHVVLMLVVSAVCLSIGVGLLIMAE